MTEYICENPECGMYNMTVEIPTKCSNPVCADCGEELEKED